MKWWIPTSCLIGLTGCTLLSSPTCETAQGLVERPRVAIADADAVLTSMNDRLISVWLAKDQAEFNVELQPTLEYLDKSLYSIRLNGALSHGFAVPIANRRPSGLNVAWCDDRRGLCIETHVDLAPTNHSVRR